MDTPQRSPGRTTPGRYAMRHGTSVDPHARELSITRARSPAGVPQPFLRSSSSFSQLHGIPANDGSMQLPRRMPSNQFSRAPQGNQETAALMARVQSVSAKADQLLLNAGRNNSQVRGPQQGPYPSERLIDLTERLARLECLLDEVANLGTFNPGSARMGTAGGSARMGTARADHMRADSVSRHPVQGYDQAYRSLSFRSSPNSEPGGPGLVGSGMVSVAPPPPTVPLVGVPPPVHGPTPRSAGRFIEVTVQTPGVPATPPVPMHPPGTYSPAIPAPSFLSRQKLPGTPMSNGPWNPASSPPPVGFWNSAEATPRAGGMGTPRVGSRAVRTSVGGYGARQEMDMPRQQISLGPNGEPVRSFSAPRGQSVPPQISVLTTAPLQQMGPPIGGTGLSTPGMPPPAGLWLPSLGQLLHDSVDSKIRRWLSTIPIGNGANRGWDDAQITEIAEFAQDKHLEHLAAEDIYKKYVEHQVAAAETAGANSP